MQLRSGRFGFDQLKVEESLVGKKKTMNK